MWEFVRPTYLFYHVEQISIDWLRAQNIRYILLDVDNTIAVWNKNEIDDGVAVWLREILNAKIQVILISNSGTARLKCMSLTYNVAYISWAMKPLRASFKKAMARWGNPDTQEVLVIGDQLFTDVWGGNKLGLKTILLTPRYSKEYIWTSLIRYLESYVLKRLCLCKKKHL